MDIRRYNFRGRVVLSLAVLFTLHLHAQTVFHWPLKLGGKITLDSLTSYLHTRTDLRFSFNSRKIKGDRVLRFAPGLYDRQRLLEAIHSGTGLYYFTVRDHVVFQDNPAPRTASAPRTKRLPAPPPPPHTAPPPRPTPDLYPVASIPDLVYSLDSPGAKPMRPAILRPHRVPPPPPVPATSADRLRGRWHLQTGIHGSNVLYFDATLEAGLHPIHLIAGWAGDGYVNGLKLGLGSVILDREKTQLQLTATVTFLKKNYPFDSTVVGFQYPVRGQLYRLDAWWCRKLGNRWLLKMAPGFDVLRTAYIVDGRPSAAINRFDFFENPDTKYYLIKAPLRVFDTFDRDKPTNLKGWISLSLGLYYRLPF